MNDDNLRTLVKNIDSDLFELINHVICSICQEFLTKPVTTPCGHSFCSGCIKRVISSKDNSGCPLCKNPVKRYGLETDKVKSTLTEIFRQLPAAFEKDVQDLSAHLNGTAEDLIKNSKIAQLSGQDYEKDVKSNKRKTLLKKSQKPSNKIENTGTHDNDVDSFVPVLKRSKNVIEYASAKKKKMDDLISISQREVESDSSVCDTSGLDKKLEQIEKVSPEEKINDWFKAVGSNIYLSSPGTNYFDLPPSRNVMEGQVLSKDAEEGNSTNNNSSIIRKNDKKVANPLHSKDNKKKDTKVVIDPYEFIPSQNKKNGKRKGRKSLKKNIPDFKALESFTKESIKRNRVNIDEGKEDGERENETEISVGNNKSSSEFPAVTITPEVITASQKFDKLMSESKENEKKEKVKAHVLYSASQASSIQFLDCSYQSQVAKMKKSPKKRRSRVSYKKIRKSISSSEQESCSNLIPKRTSFSTKCPNTRTKNVDEGESVKSKQKHSLDGDEAKADERQSFSEIMDLKSEEALDLEKSVEEYLMKFKKDNKSLKGVSCEKHSQQTRTKLIELLGELTNDDIVHNSHPRNAPMELKNQRKAEEKDSEVSSCEKTFQQKRTKLMELLGELANDETVYKDHPRSTPVEVKSQRKAEDREKDSNVSSREKTFQRIKTKSVELLKELINDGVVYKSPPKNTPVALKTRRKGEEKDLKVTFRENISQKTKTKSIELLEELINDNVVDQNHEKNTPVELKNRGKGKEKDSKISSCEKTFQQTKPKLIELLRELINDGTVDQNLLKDALVELKNREKGEEREKDLEVTSCQKTSQQTKTKLMELLEELINDDVIYKNHPRNVRVELKNGRKSDSGFEGNIEKPTCNESSPSPPDHTSHEHLNVHHNSKLSGKEKSSKPIDDLKSGKLTQGTHLLGFGTQEELTDEKMFKEMVQKMEKELELSEGDLKRTSLEQCNEKRDENSALNNSYNKDSLSPNPKHSNFILFNCLGKIRKNKSSFINFLRLGRLTPTVRRSRSSVVKLVFPIGLSSFARKRCIQDKLPTGINSSKSLLSVNDNSLKNETCVPSSRNELVSTGIQTSQRLASSPEIQTSHISKSVVVQTSQVLKPSVEVQTVKENCCAWIQTSQIPNPEKSVIYKSAEIQTSEPQWESPRRNVTLLRDNRNDVETEYIPGSVGYDELEFLPKKNNSRDFGDAECSFRKMESLKDRTSSLEKEVRETSLSPSRLPNKNKRKGLSPTKKHFYKHRKISGRKRFEEEESWLPQSQSREKIEDGRFQDKSCPSSLIVDSEMKREFVEAWVIQSQKTHRDFIETKNKRNRGEEAVSKEPEMSSPTKKRRNSPSHFTQNLSGLIDEVLQKFETRQRIPLDVRKVSSDDDYEMVDLGTPETVQQTSQQQVLQVLKNIDLDLKGKENDKGNGKGACTSENVGNNTKGEKCEESDSDFFVEQTPPRPSNSRIVDQESVNSSKFDGRRENDEKEKGDEKKALNSQGTDLIGDSLPKDHTEAESFLMVSAPQKVPLTPEKREGNNVTCLEKRGKSGSQSFPKEKSFSTIQKMENFPKANENDQNQLNAAFETKSNQLMAWIKADESPGIKVGLRARQRLCVVASSVKNLDLIKKFVIKFKLEYSNKPIKNMTHLVVGLHESEEEGEVLPLCTPKLLFAMANKKWVVSEAWVQTCLKMGVIASEEAFEALDPVGGQGCRNARLSTQPLLRDIEVYLLGHFQAISKEDFAGLILDCGGTVVQKPEQFSFSPLKLRMIVADQDCLNMDKNQLQELYEKYSTVILSRDVILMSIQSYKLANFNPHLLHPISEEELLKMGYPSQLVRSEEDDSSSN